jgi:hypothetical protein
MFVDNSTSHSKIPADALFTQGLLRFPGGKYVTSQRTTTWEDKDGTLQEKPFVFKQGDELLFEAKGVRASPSATEGAVLSPRAYS